MKNLWRIWAKTLGNKITDYNREADIAAIFRTVWVTFQIITCAFIIAGVIRHW